MAKVEAMEARVHGRARDAASDDELRFGVVDEALYARRAPPLDGAQWTGVVTGARWAVGEAVV